MARLGRLKFPWPLFAYPFYLWNRSPGKQVGAGSALFRMASDPAQMQLRAHDIEGSSLSQQQLEGPVCWCNEGAAAAAPYQS